MMMDVAIVSNGDNGHIILYNLIILRCFYHRVKSKRKATTTITTMNTRLTTALFALFAAFSAEAFAPVPSSSAIRAQAPSSALYAKYNTMDEILALFPEDKPVLVNFYDAATEDDIKADIMRAKQLLADRATLVSIKQQDYPELAKKWDCDDKSPAMILFKDGTPVTRLYEETHYLEIVAKIGQFAQES